MNFFTEYSNLSTSLQVLVLAFAILGILFGLIFVIDGWKTIERIESPENSLRENPNILTSSSKFLGLIYILGAGALPTLTELIRVVGLRSNEAPGIAIAIYSLFVGISALVSIFFLSLYAFVVTFSKLHEYMPDKPCWLKSFHALPLVSIALQRGNEAFLEEINYLSNYLSELQDLSNLLREQRDYSISFLTGVFDRLVKNNIRRINGVEEFIKFLRNYLEVFIKQFLDFDNNSDQYRASIYFLPSESKSLSFVCGYSHWSCLHSGKDLSFDESLAGYALKNPGEIYIYTEGDESSSRHIPFQNRDRHVRYNTVIVCAVQPLRPKSDSSIKSSMVLCIDSIAYDAQLFELHKEFITRITLFFAVVISTAQASMKVTDDDLERYLSGHNSSDKPVTPSSDEQVTSS